MAADFDSTGLGAEKKVSVPAILENRRIDTLSDNWLLCVELPSTIVPQPNP
jgi:hypothetical protein